MKTSDEKGYAHVIIADCSSFLLTLHNPSDMIDLGVRGRRQIKT